MNLRTYMRKIELVLVRNRRLSEININPNLTLSHHTNVIISQWNSCKSSAQINVNLPVVIQIFQCVQEHVIYRNNGVRQINVDQ